VERCIKTSQAIGPKISIAAALGVINGYPEGNFGPDDLITREQMAVMVVKATGLNGRFL